MSHPIGAMLASAEAMEAEKRVALVAVSAERDELRALVSQVKSLAQCRNPFCVCHADISNPEHWCSACKIYGAITRYELTSALKVPSL